MATEEENKAVLRAYIAEVANTGDVSGIARYVAEDFVEHYGPPGLPGGIAGATALVKLFSDNFEGYRFEIEEMLADGDKVLVRGWGSGKHTGPFLGIAPTGKEMRFRAAHVFQVVDGKLAARWAYADTLGLLQQLGAVPMPGAPPPGR
jgi:predicted ester cyclase